VTLITAAMHSGEESFRRNNPPPLRDDPPPPKTPPETPKPPPRVGVLGICLLSFFLSILQREVSVCVFLWFVWFVWGAKKGQKGAKKRKIIVPQKQQ
tara:strand:- start:249 stop:539 length:291 start_codon:yes stop_codon:yes gene_type:complete